jgi:5-methylcytosine-specific restriction endonuclease McrA
MGKGLRVFPKPCLKCKALFTFRSEYCDTCRLERKPREQKPRVYSAERKARKGFLYGGDYRERAKLVKDTATHCHICQQPFSDRKEIQADHLIPGNPESPLAAAHRVCNARKGNRYIG